MSETQGSEAGERDTRYLDSSHHMIDEDNLRGLSAVVWAAGVDIVDALDRLASRVGDAIDAHVEEMGRWTR